MSLQDLLAQKNDIDRQIAQLRNQERTDAMAKVRALMAEHGLTPADLVAVTGKPRPNRSGTAGKPVAAKYRDDSGNTWTGRGLKPRWLTAALAAGKSMSDFAV
jgi:DNA-binding protein H-NS